MSQCSDHHLKVDKLGFAKCSVPMWCEGMPGGFCDEEAYGERPPCETFMNYSMNERQRVDGKYDGYVPGLACPAHGGPNSRVFLDGNSWCAVYKDFINLQESPAGFGATPEEARENLKELPHE